MANARFKIFVAKLPWTAGGDTLRSYFQQYGNVTSSRVIFDQLTGRSRNFGFVQFETEDSFKKALDTNDHFVDGQKVFVQPMAKEGDSRKYQQQRPRGDMDHSEV